MAQCSANSFTTGQQCRAQAVTGTTVCRRHGGALPVVTRKAIVRAELMHWGLEDKTEDPGELLLRLVTQSAKRCALYAQLLEQLYDQEALIGSESWMPALPGGVQALIGGTYDSTSDGRVYQTGEQIRGLVMLEAQERDRCANFCTKAIAAGLAERQVRIAERQGEAIITAIVLALDAAGVTGEARIRAQNAAADHLLALSA